MVTDHLEHPAVKALIEKNKRKIHDLKDSLGAEGEIFGTLLRPGSSLEKMKFEESHSSSLQLKEEIQESHGAIEVIVGKPAVSKNLNIESANQFFSPPGRPATTLEELIDGVSTVEETPDFVPNHLSNQHHILTTKQETIPVSCDTTQPLEETAVTISEVPTFAVDYSNKQHSSSSESIRSAEPIEGASTATQQVAPISETSDQHQHSSAEQTNIGCSEIQPSSFNVNSDAVPSLCEQQVTSLDKLQAFPEIQLSSALSDSAAVEVIDEEIIPHFRTPSGKTTKPQVLSKQHTALKRKFPERVTLILQLHYESSREGRGFKSQFSLVKSFIQLLKYFSHQLKNSLVNKVIE